MQQFPQSVKRTLAAIDYNNTNLIGQTLTNLDAIYRENEQNFERKQYYTVDEAQANGPGDDLSIRQVNIGNNYNGYNGRHNNKTRRGRSNMRNRPYGNTINNTHQQNPVSNVNREIVSLPDTRFPPPLISNANNRNNVSSN